MALITTGLTNGGLTTHYQFQYDDSLSQADGKDRANGLIAVCEADYNLMSDWFGGIALTVGTPITVNISPGGYASAGWGPPIRLTPGNGSSLTLVRYLLVSEVTEMFMLAQNKGWFAPDGSNEQSCGEGLSRFLAHEFLIAKGLGVSEPGFELAPSWMNSSIPPISTTYGSRGDFVNNTLEYDHGIDPATGCAILFIYYLYSQLNYSIKQIIAAAPGVASASSCLRGVYQNLTKNAGDPFPHFKALLDGAFPPGVPASIPGPNPDNPFPLGIRRLPIYEQVAQILYGIINDGGGAEIIDGKIIHVPPGDPELDILLGIASYRIASIVSNPEGIQLQKAAMNMVVKVAQQQLQSLAGGGRETA